MGAGGNKGAVVGRVQVWGHQASICRSRHHLVEFFPIQGKLMGQIPTLCRKPCYCGHSSGAGNPSCTQFPNQVPRMRHHLFLLRVSLAQGGGPQSHVGPPTPLWTILFQYASLPFPPTKCSRSISQSHLPPARTPPLVSIFHLSKHCPPYIIYSAFNI